MLFHEVPKPYSMRREKLLTPTYTILYWDTPICTGFERDIAFRVVSMLNGAFLEGVNHVGGIEYQ